MGHGKAISVAIGLGAWLIAAALNILHGPQWLGWICVALGSGFFITAGLWWIHGSFQPASAQPTRQTSTSQQETTKPTVGAQAPQEAQQHEHEASPLERASLEEIGELGARFAKTSKAIYAFLNKNATRTDEPKVIAEYLHKFDAQVMGLYNDLIMAGLSSPEQLESGMRPLASVQDIKTLARTLASNGEAFSAERLQRNSALAMGELTKQKLPHKSSCPPRPRVETFMRERPDGIEVETTHCMECGAATSRIDIPTDLRPFVDEWRTSYRDMSSLEALEHWMDQRRIPEAKRGQFRERTEAFSKAIMEDAP